MAGAGTIPYEPVTLLHEGLSTAVFSARDKRGAAVVLKRLRAGGSADWLGARRFEREIMLAATLSHPGLAQMLDHGSDWAVFEELVPALAQEQTRHAYGSPAAVRLLLSHLAATLAYLHARGVVHRDVKPAHVLFRAAQPVLIDLGVAGLISDDVLEGSEYVGSPAWMAPEQATGARPSPSADIWSLAALGAWLLLDTAPFSGSADDVLDMRRSGAEPAFRLSEIGRIDGGLAALIKAGLGPAEQRPSAADIVNALG